MAQHLVNPGGYNHEIRAFLANIDHLVDSKCRVLRKSEDATVVTYESGAVLAPTYPSKSGNVKRHEADLYP